MRIPVYTRQFARDIKRARKRGEKILMNSRLLLGRLLRARCLIRCIATINGKICKSRWEGIAVFHA